jgi:hypothetical protein
MENGLQTPITVFHLGNKDNPKDHETIRGHRRVRSIREIFAENPKVYKKLFPKGVPVTILKGINYETAQLMKVDDSNYLPLSNPFEVQLCANKLFSALNPDGQSTLSEKAVTLRMTGILDRMYPMKAKKKAKLEEMKADVSLLTVKGLVKEAEVKQRELDDFIFEYRRGKIQNMHAAFRCPDIVMAALKFKADGKKPDNWDEKVYLPDSLNSSHVDRLWKAFKSDLDLDKEKRGTLKYSKRNPGTTFLAKWDEICKSLQEDAEKPKTIRPKAMSATSIKEQKWISTGFTQLSLQHAGDAEINADKLMELDTLAYMAEIVSERAPKEWAEIETLVSGLEKEIQAERQEVAAKK